MPVTITEGLQLAPQKSHWIGARRHICIGLGFGSHHNKVFIHSNWNVQAQALTPPHTMGIMSPPVGRFHACWAEVVCRKVLLGMGIMPRLPGKVVSQESLQQEVVTTREEDCLSSIYAAVCLPCLEYFAFSPHIVGRDERWHCYRHQALASLVHTILFDKVLPFILSPLEGGWASQLFNNTHYYCCIRFAWAPWSRLHHCLLTTINSHQSCCHHQATMAYWCSFLLSCRSLLFVLVLITTISSSSIIHTQTGIIMNVRLSIFSNTITMVFRFAQED